MWLNTFSNLLLLLLSNTITANANFDNNFVTSINGCSFENLKSVPGYSADIYSHNWGKASSYYQTFSSTDQYESDLITTIPIVSNPNIVQNKNYESINAEITTADSVTQLTGYFYGMLNLF